jgi:mannose-6-phosphate isomerase-like protein (cupin superfamily)
MSIDVKRTDVRRFADDKLQKIGLHGTPRLFCDVYCLEPGQAQRRHVHQGADKIYVVLEGKVKVHVGTDEAQLGPGDTALAPSGEEHGVENPGPARAALLVFMAPPPSRHEGSG